MSFPEKVKAVFEKYGMTELKSYHMLNLYDDVLVCYTEDQKERQKWLKGKCKEYAKLVVAQSEKYAEDARKRKQKLQDFLVWLKNWTSDGIIIAKFEELLKE